MSLGNLGKKLQRDLKANPKKGLLLLLMVCGAGYFWGPILKRWGGGKSGKPGAVASAPVILDDPKPLEAAGKFKPPSWEKLQEFLQRDELTKSAALPETFRDPFAIAALIEKQSSETSPVQEQPKSTTKSGPLAGTPDNGEPTVLDLTVTSVVFGPRGRMASIAGTVVWEGDVFEMKDKATPAAEAVNLVVRRVEPWGVLLEHDGREYKALMATGKLKLNPRVAPEAAANP